MQGTNTDFMTSFRGLRTQAIAHGLDPNEEQLRMFIVHTAEVMAQQRFETRVFYNAMHKQMEKNSEHHDLPR